MRHIRTAAALAVAVATSLPAATPAAAQSLEVKKMRVQQEADLSTALERLRSTHLTVTADAAELRDLFASVEAISLVADGLARANAALAGATHR